VLNSSYNEKCFTQNLYRNSKQILRSKTFFFENRAFYEIMWGEKNCIAGQASDENVAHSHCMLDN